MLGLNVNKTTSMLAKLADNALQGYASMHKSNPYILSLAVAEANRRKELRASRGAQAAPQPQPKVADVAIANMASSPEEQGYGALPEQRGIGALPANNMRMMADGGIVGYDDQEPVQMMSRGGRANMYGDGPSLFDSALDQEKVTNPAERAFLKAIHVQESGGKSSAKTSNQNAHGAMQVIPSTFKAMADPGMDINNPLDNMRAGIRFGRQGFRAAGGDPVLAGAFYYGGPGGMRKLQRGVTVSDPKNPKAPNTRQYGESVARRMQQLLGNTQAKPQRPAPTFIEPPARETPPMLFAAAPQSDGIPSHSEAPIGDVRMGQHAGIEDDTRALAAQQATQMMAGGGVARYNGEFDSVVGISPEFGGEPPEPYSAPPDQASMRKVASPAFQNRFVTQVPRNPEEAAMLQRFPAPGKAASEKERPDLIQSGGGADLPSMPGMDIPGMFSSAMDSAQKRENPFAKDIEAMGKDRVKAAQADVAGLEAIHARFDDIIFKGRKERMGTREEEVGKLKEEAGRMAGISFGLALAKTPGKGLSGILSGLTAGADASSKEYARGMDKFRAAQEKLNDAKDRLEELEVNRAELNARELHKGRMAVRTTMVDVQKDMIAANMQMYNLNEAKGMKMFEAQMQMGLEQLRQSGANARANAPTTDMREAMLLGTGKTPEEKYLSGLKVKQSLLGDKQGTQLFKMFLEENGRREKNMETPLTLDQFRRQSSAFFAPPPAVDISKPTRP